ncbi:MAG: ribonuclease P protein component, partial [Ruminococcus sp.]
MKHSTGTEVIILQTQTITRNKDFLTLYRYGKTVVSPYVVIYVRKNKLKCRRLGITAGKKVGGAVQRNRAKRVIRAAYRGAESLLPEGIDM